MVSDWVFRVISIFGRRARLATYMANSFECFILKITASELAFLGHMPINLACIANSGIAFLISSNVPDMSILPSRM